jgi:molybdopterin-containing oxidoreductase family iron-sulfur binding subunit
MPSLNHTSGRAYWRSLDELAQTPEFRAFVENEFPNHAAEMLSPSRRQFLKIMGASFALGGLMGCRRWPEEKVAPFAYRPPGRVPGTHEQYATATEIGGAAVGLLVTSFDGRPIKIEGNPLHPASLGAASAQAQASVLELYDPDRNRFPLQRLEPATKPAYSVRTWDEFLALAGAHFADLRKNGGAGLAVLSEANSGPSMADMRRRWQQAFPQAKWYEYEPISWDNQREGARLAFGRPLRMQLDLSKADVIVSLGADLLGTHPNALRYARQWAERRKVDAGADARMNRMYVAESTYTITGSVADHRLPIRSADITGLLSEIRLGLGGELKVNPLAAQDLIAAKGRGILVAGPDQPPEVHAVVAADNARLGNSGTTVTFTADPDPDRPSHVDAIKALVEQMRGGQVKTLLILGGNPVYNAPADLGFADALSKVGTAIHLSLYDNETSIRCHWSVPQAHYLEAWSDARGWDGTVSVVQPLIEPLYNGKTSVELLATLSGEPEKAGYDIVRRTFASLLPKDDFEKSWRRVLHDGLVEGSEYKPVDAKPQSGAAAKYFDNYRRNDAAILEVTFIPDRKVYDGRFANNGWLQETPDSLTQLTWDNAALISVHDANARGIKNGDIIRLKANGRELEIAAYVLPGQAQSSIAVPLGYGRSVAGRVGEGVGFNAYALRTSDGMYTTVVGIDKTARTYKLATAQDHHAIDRVGYEERQKRVPHLVREIPLPVFQQNPEAVQEGGHKANLLQLWEHPLDYEDHRWGMAVDLTSCIGCNACVVACQAENNIPIVGKEEVLVGREMHWIRIDRYFSGDPEAANPPVAYQPMTCHHCENAPCESVCPVSATVHDTEGLNAMIYNRCIGTRYCSNNCPYKVRRFNYFDYHSKGPAGARLPWLGMPDSQQVKEVDTVRRLGFNPEVTVRMRGVMEKCTFCVQRIQLTKIQANNEGRPIRDGEITPACAQTCPTQTIVFGDLNDANSRVRKLQESNRSYFILEELNVRPRLKYLAKLTNPREDLAEAPAEDERHETKHKKDLTTEAQCGLRPQPNDAVTRQCGEKRESKNLSKKQDTTGL